jgi:superfamily II DNA or RNA helicase
VESVNELERRGVRRVLVVAPTGAGKTTIAGHLITKAASQGQRVLFLAHRRELISQAYSRLLQMGVKEKNVGVVMATDPRRRPGAPVQVASVATLARRPKPLADIVFIDEAHRALAKTYQDISSHYAGALHLGLTATPYRADGKGLGDMYDELVTVASPRQLIDEGYLVEPRVLTVPLSDLPDLSRVKLRGGDYAESALAAAVDQTSLVGNIVDHWQEHARGVRTVAFATSVEHSRHITDRFLSAGVPAEHLDGTTPGRQRDAILQRLESGQTLVVSNCGVLCEGWDQPAVKCAILARPTKSTGLYLQQAGRILRPFGGQQAIILDHAGCALEHGLPQDEREFSLEDSADKSGELLGEVPTKVCEQCFTVVPAATRTCPACGFEFEGREMPIEQEGTLVEVTPASLAAAKSAPVPTRHTPARRRRMDPRMREVLTRAVREGRSCSWEEMEEMAEAMQ